MEGILSLVPMKDLGTARGKGKEKDAEGQREGIG